MRNRPEHLKRALAAKEKVSFGDGFKLNFARDLFSSVEPQSVRNQA